MRIAHILMTRQFAGSERYAVELANAQSTQHTVAMLMPASEVARTDGGWAQHLAPSVQRIGIQGWKPFWGQGIRKALTQWAPAVAHAHLSVGCKALGGWHSPALRVATLHIDYKPQQHAKLDALIAIAPWQLAHIPLALAAHSQAIANWSAPPSVDAGARARWRAELGLSDTDWVVGTLGRAEHSKGWDVLIEAFMAARLPGARLVLVGAGRDWARIRRQAPPEVLMPGFTQAPEACFAGFDLFVSAARSEPFGLVFLEAMHAQLPVLATATEGAKFLGDSFELPLVPPADAAALTHALQQAAAQRPARRAHPMARFDPAQQIARIEAFYLASLQAHSAHTPKP